jgi:hypothetical protein
VADRAAHDFIYQAVHRGARCPSVGDNMGSAWQPRRRLRHRVSVPIWRKERDGA